jgi:hypothetical protein
MFGKDQYIKILSEIKSNNYKYSTNLDQLKDGDCFLRHDIDFSLEFAVEIAEIEESLGVQANYFFMLTSNMYNLLSKDSLVKVQYIRSLGHTVSLHFDPVCHKDIDIGFSSEKAIFENFLCEDISLVSLHRPGDFLNNNDRKLEGVNHTYETKFFNDFLYISDSSGINPTDKLRDLYRMAHKPPLQLLMHPIWWVLEEDSPTAMLNHWIKSRFKYIESEILLNCKSYLGMKS